MVVSVHRLAADGGLSILQEGGNAIDAAVATGFALAVVHPSAGNLGGGGFMLIRDHTGKTIFLDYREKAPLAATENMYLDASGNVIPDASVLGYRSIATPGSVAGLVYAEKKYGRLGLKRVMAPAIQLAREGFVLTAQEASELSDPDLARFPASYHIFQRDGHLYKAGETFRQPLLAATLERIAADPDDFYHGAMARQLVADLSKGGALLTLDDLAQYTVVEREPIVGTFHNFTVISAPPPSSGGIVLISALNILESYAARDARRSQRRMGSSDYGSVASRLYGSRRLPRRSRLQHDSRGRVDREKLRCRMARKHPTRSRVAERRTRTPRGLCAGCARDSRAAPPP